MNWNIFERRSALKIKKHTSDLDTEAMWQAVQPQLGSRKKRPFIFLWVGAALMLGSFSIAYSLMGNSEPLVLSENKISAPVEIVSERITNQSPKELNLNQIKKEKAPVTKSAKLESIVSESSSVKQIKKVVNEKSIFAKDTFIPKGNTNINKLALNKNIDFSKRPSHSDYIKEVENDIGDTQKINQPAESSNFIASLEAIKLSILEQPASNFELLKPNYQTLPVEERISIEKKQALSFSIGLRSGIGAINKNISTTTSNATDFINLKESIEQMLETLNAALVFKVKHSSNLFVSSGLEYKRLNERIAIQDEFTFSETDQNAIIEIYTDENNDQFVTRGTANKMSTLALDLVHYNSHEIFAIPVSIGYEFNLNALRISPEVGVNFNLSNTSRGRTLTGTSYLDLIDIEQEDYYKTNLGISYIASLNFNYLLGSNYEIGLAPYYEVLPNSFTINSATFSEYYQRLGVNLNLSYNF